MGTPQRDKNGKIVAKKSKPPPVQIDEEKEPVKAKSKQTKKYSSPEIFAA